MKVAIVINDGVSMPLFCKGIIDALKHRFKDIHDFRV